MRLADVGVALLGFALGVLIALLVSLLAVATGYAG